MAPGAACRCTGTGESPRRGAGVKGAAWSRLAKPITGIVFAVAAGTWTVGQLREQEVARRDQQALARMTQKMKTICVGRFLVDMPEEARLELTRPRIHGFDISSLEFTMDTGKSAKGP